MMMFNYVVLLSKYAYRTINTIMRLGLYAIIYKQLKIYFIMQNCKEIFA